MMRARFLRGVVGVVTTLSLMAITFPPAPGAFQPDKGAATEQVGKKPVQPPQGESSEQRQRGVIRAQLEWQELQKKHIEEQLAEQIQQLERDTKGQIAQLRQQARRQIEILEAQKRLYLAQAESQLAQTGENAAGRPPAISVPIAEKLDKILDRLEDIDKRLQKLEKGTPR
jgi:hypothetical protein